MFVQITLQQLRYQGNNKFSDKERSLDHTVRFCPPEKNEGLVTINMTLH